MKTKTPGPRLPPQPQSITGLWPAPKYGLLLLGMRVNNVSTMKVKRSPAVEPPPPSDYKSNILTVTPLQRHDR